MLKTIVISLVLIAFFHGLTLLNIALFEPKTLTSLELLLIIIIYWLAFFSYLRLKKDKNNTSKNEQSYYKSLQNDEIESCLAVLEKAFETEKMYLNPELTLQILSQNLQISPRVISAVLNQKLNKGFNEYVNEYRIEEAQKLLKNAEKSNLTIAAIAYQSGFNSLATFQRAFKKITGKTPKYFLEK